MSLRTRFLGIADRLLDLTGPSRFDIRTNQLTVRQRTWTGGVGVGSYVDSDLVLPQKYAVRVLSQREIASSGGRYRQGDIIVGPITPSDGEGAGFTPEQLRPVPESGEVEILYVITGPLAGRFHLVDSHFDQPFGYFLTLARSNG